MNPSSSTLRIRASAPEKGEVSATLKTLSTVKRQTIRSGDLEIVTETWSSEEVASASGCSDAKRKETRDPVQETPKRTLEESRSLVHQIKQTIEPKDRQYLRRDGRSYPPVRRPKSQAAREESDEKPYISRSVKELRKLFEG